jgi:hypothetical protein
MRKRADFLPSPAIAQWWQNKTDPEGASRRRVFKAASRIMATLMQECRENGGESVEDVAELLCVAHIIHVDVLRVVGAMLGEDQTKLFELELASFRRSLGMAER